MKHILSYLITGVGLWIAVTLVSGFDFSGSWWAFAGVTLLLWAVNGVVKPIINILSIPLVVLTLGLFLLITNALALQLVVWLSEPGRLDLGLSSTGFFWATFLGALVISVVRLVLDKLLRV
jgi:putative membrane protein